MTTDDVFSLFFLADLNFHLNPGTERISSFFYPPSSCPHNIGGTSRGRNCPACFSFHSLFFPLLIVFKRGLLAQCCPIPSRNPKSSSAYCLFSPFHPLTSCPGRIVKTPWFAPILSSLSLSGWPDDIPPICCSSLIFTHTLTLVTSFQLVCSPFLYGRCEPSDDGHQRAL